MKKMMFLLLLLSALWAMPACHNNSIKATETPVEVMIDTTISTSLYDTLNLDPEVVA